MYVTVFRLMLPRTSTSFVRISSLPTSQKTSSSSVKKTYVSSIAKEMNAEVNTYTGTRIFPPTIYSCSRFKDCSSECCIDGQCVDSYRCKPVFAARGGRGGGGGGRGSSSRGGYRGVGGGGHSGSGSGSLNWPLWAVLVLVFGIILIVFLPFIIMCICCD